MPRDFLDKLFGSCVIDRAETLYREVGINDNRLTLVMDIDNANKFCPLNLDILAEMDDSNFAHDILGIRRHINRKTGQLEDFFVPRCATFQHEVR